MTKKKRIVLVVLSILAAILVSISLTLAYLSDSRVVTNTFSFGQVSVKVTESPWEVDPVDKTRVLTPGSRVGKDPMVENDGNTSCYVRAVIDIGDGVLEQGGHVKDFITMGALDAGWEVGEGTWGSEHVVVYYKNKLDVGDKTSKIFTHFMLNSQDGAGKPLLEGANNNFKIVVKVEAVQSAAEGIVIDSPQDAFEKLFAG